MALDLQEMPLSRRQIIALKGYRGNKFERLELPDIYDDDEDEISYDDSSDD